MASVLGLLWNRLWSVPQAFAVMIFGIAAIFRYGPRNAMIVIECLHAAIDHAIAEINRRKKKA